MSTILDRCPELAEAMKFIEGEYQYAKLPGVPSTYYPNNSSDKTTLHPVVLVDTNPSDNIASRLAVLAVLQWLACVDDILPKPMVHAEPGLKASRWYTEE